MKDSRYRDRFWQLASPLAGAIFFLILGLGAVWFARKTAGVQDGVVLASFVIVPALIYVVLRGDLAELRGPGGWEASFVRVAKSEVNVQGDKLVVEKRVEVIEKGYVIDDEEYYTDDLPNLVHRVKRELPIIMTLSLGSTYTVQGVRAYLNKLSRFPRFRLVAFLNESGDFLGCIGPSELGGLMRSQELGEEFLETIAGADEEALFRYPGTLKNVVNADSTNADALTEMTKHNLDAIAVVDESRRLLGVVEREQLVSKLLLSLVPR